MKKLISLILSAALILSILPAAFAAAGSIEDDLADTTRIYSSIPDKTALLIEKKTLDTYQDATYATSNKGTLEFVYELEKLASFEVTTLNYKGNENITFSIAAEADGSYTQLSGYQRTEANIPTTKGTAGNWTKIQYAGTITDQSAKYFKISINQTSNKFIRLDHVRLLSSMEPAVEKVQWSKNGTEITGENIFGADSLTVTLNQPVKIIPKLTITSEKNEALEVAGGYGANQSQVIYSFNALGLGIYNFSAQGFQSLTGKSCNLNQKAGITPVYKLPDQLHFGEQYSVEGLLDHAVSAGGTEFPVTDVQVECKTPDILEIGETGLNLKAPGEAQLVLRFTMEQESYTAEKTVTVCGIQELRITPDSMKLSAGESMDFTVSLILSDKTEIPAEQLSAVSSDTTVATTDGKSVRAVKEGSTFINLTVDYYGIKVTGLIAVGVGKDPEQAAAAAEITANRSGLIVGESMYAVVRCRLKNGDEADSLAVKKKFYSTNERILNVSEDGRITAASAGIASVYAEVSLGGAAVRSNRFEVTVSEDFIASAAIIVPSDVMVQNTVFEPEICALSRLGKKLDAEAVYQITGSALKLNEDGTIIAAAAGTAELAAEVTCDGVTVQTPAVSITVTENNSCYVKDFVKDQNWNGVFAYNNLMLYHDSGVMALDDSVTLPDQYVIFQREDAIKGVRLTAYFLNDRQADDIQIHVSSDGEHFERSPENVLETEIQNKTGTAWYYIWLSYSGELLENAKYIKVVIDRSAADGNHAAGIRLHAVEIEHDHAPAVIGISRMDRNGILTDTVDTERVAISFSQEVDKDSLGNILLKSGANKVKTSGSYANGIYTLFVDGLEEQEYTLTISGVKNKWGTVSADQTYSFTPKSTDLVSVSNIRISGGVITAELHNQTDRKIFAAVVTVTYDQNGMVSGVYVDQNVEIYMGSNAYTSSGNFDNAKSAKIYVWKSMNDLDVF